MATFENILKTFSFHNVGTTINFVINGVRVDFGICIVQKRIDVSEVRPVKTVG